MRLLLLMMMQLLLLALPPPPFAPRACAEQRRGRAASSWALGPAWRLFFLVLGSSNLYDPVPEITGGGSCFFVLSFPRYKRMLSFL